MLMFSSWNTNNTPSWAINMVNHNLYKLDWWYGLIFDELMSCVVTWGAGVNILYTCCLESWWVICIHLSWWDLLYNDMTVLLLYWKADQTYGSHLEPDRSSGSIDDHVVLASSPLVRVFSDCSIYHLGQNLFDVLFCCVLSRIIIFLITYRFGSLGSHLCPILLASIGTMSSVAIASFYFGMNCSCEW